MTDDGIARPETIDALEAAAQRFIDDESEGRIVTEWAFVAVSQAADDDECEYHLMHKPSMLAHHVAGLFNMVNDVLDVDDV